MKLKRLLISLVIILIMTSQIIPVCAGLDGKLSPVTVGGGSGNWDAIPRADSLLRLSIIRQEKGTYKNFGFMDNYPDNFGRTLILGGTGNTRTNNIGHFQDGALGYINSGHVFFDNNWLGDNTRNIGSMFHEALMNGVDVYKGEGTSRLMSSLEMSWTAWVGHTNLTAANRGSTALPSVSEMTNKMSLSRITDQTPESMKPMANAMVLLGAYLNGERSGDFDLGDIWNFYVGNQSNYEYLLMLENLHYFSQNGVGLYIHQNQVIAAVAGRTVYLNEYQGDTLNFINRIIGKDNLTVATGTRIRKGGHSSTFNLIFDYLFDPTLASNGHARNTYYSRNERHDSLGNKMWDAEFTDSGPILDDYTKAKTGFAIYSEMFPGMPITEPEAVEGKHKLFSASEAIDADSNEKVTADQFINWKQDDSKLNEMADVIIYKLEEAARDNHGFASLEFDSVEYTITEIPSDHKGGFSIINDNMPMDFSLNYNANNVPNNLKQQIINALRTQFSDITAWAVSTEEGTFDTPGIYVWKYDSSAEFIYRINSTQETFNLIDSQAQTIIRIPASSSEQLRWFNTPLAFAEVKEGTFSDDRTTEKWEAMNGVPTTETLYINAGGTPVYIDIIARYFTESFYKQYTGTDTTSCPGHGYAPLTYCTTGSDSAHEEIGHTSCFVKITGITFRTADKAKLESTKVFVNGTEEVPISGKVSITLNPSSKVYTKSLGLPATNNYGFTTAEVSRHANTTGTCRAPDGKIAVNQAKSTDTANAFAQSDKITISIEGITYEIIDGKIVQSPANATSFNDTTRDSFIPLKEKWDVTTKIPFIGYIGQPRAASTRNISSVSNSNKLRFYKTGVTIPLNQVNGLYVFEPIDQVMVYGAAQALVGENSGSVPDNVSGHSGSGITILADYVNYQSTGAPHALSDVDYPGPNCLILHNPVSAQDIFVYDIPDTTLQDQRIGKNSFTTTRSYIDYAFKLTIPNSGSFEINEAGTKRADLLEHSLLKIHRKPGVLGKSFTGAYKTAFNTLLRGTAYPSGTTDSANMNTDKWVRAKYIKLPFNAYYESTYLGAATGFHNANTWIRLYDQGRGAAVTNDPTEFTFFITSDVPDMKDATITYLAEAINAPLAFAGNPEALASDAEKNANTLRNTEGVYLDMEGDIIAELSAKHSASYSTRQDVIGRIGNVIVDDVNDPRWANVFWPPGSRWLIENLVRVPQFQPGGKFFSLYFNLFEEQSVSTAFNNRWNTLSEYYPGNHRQGTLPITAGSNPRQGLSYSAVKMGYSSQFSVQTLGSYGDGILRITPKYMFVNPSKGIQTENISMFINESGVFKEFYKASNQTNAATAKAYSPAANFVLGHTLKDERAKINTAEKQTPSYISATSTNKVKLGTPSYIEIPPSLRTYIGGTTTTGTTGIGNSHAGSTGNTDGSFRNAQRWHGRLALPSSTNITPEGSTNVYDPKGSYLITYLKIETANSTAPWELEITTNTAINTAGHPNIITVITPFGEPPVTINTPQDNPTPHPQNSCYCVRCRESIINGHTHNRNKLINNKNTKMGMFLLIARISPFFA